MGVVLSGWVSDSCDQCNGHVNSAMASRVPPPNKDLDKELEKPVVSLSARLVWSNHQNIRPI